MPNVENDALYELADCWDGGQDVGIAHVEACQDFRCKTCVAIACAADLRAALATREVTDA